MSLAERGEAASKHWNKTMTTKTITAKIVVPEWAKWVATDENGATYAYCRKPELWDVIWSNKGPQVEFVCTTTPTRNWRKTLRRVG